MTGFVVGQTVGGGCKTSTGDCDFNAILRSFNETHNRIFNQISTCSTYGFNFDTGEPLGLTPAWCITNNEKQLVGDCVEDTCPGVKQELFNIEKRNQVNQCDCGVRNEIGQRIFKGRTASLGEFPWQVALLDKASGEPHVFAQFCGGALVGMKHVITAAHCVETSGDQDYNPEEHNRDPGDVSVLLGATNIIMAEEKENMKRITMELDIILIHPGYVKNKDGQVLTKLVNDVAVLVFKSEINLQTYPNIKPVCLPKTPMSLKNKDALISGWGKSGSTDQTPKQSELKHAKVKIIGKTKTDCKFLYEENASIFCALGKKFESTCQGDSGGPVVINEYPDKYFLYGVTSHGPPCDGEDPNKPMYYADISYFLYEDDKSSYWLRKTLEDAKGCNGKKLFKKGCPKGWQLFEEQCFKVYTDKWVSPNKAQQKCQDQKANLASVTTEKMQKHIFTVALNAAPSINTDNITGYYQGQLTIGARQGSAFVETQEEGAWNWVDGSKWMYENWPEYGEPNDAYGGEDCVEIVMSRDDLRKPFGFWNDINCGIVTKNAFVCSKKPN